MEVKEIQPVPTPAVVAPTMDDLPNEVLVHIFRPLPFDDRLRLSLVCKRWNQLIFNFLDADIYLCLCEDDRDVPAEGTLSEHRLYRQVKLCGTTFEGLEGVHEERIEALAAGARSLILEIREPMKEEFIEMMKKFSGLRSLTISCEEFCDDAGEGEGRGLLPNLERLAFEQLGRFRDTDPSGLLELFMRKKKIRHFVIRYADRDFHKIVEWTDLLNVLAPRLLSLNLNIQSFLMRYLCKMNFNALTILDLRVEFTVEGFTPEKLVKAIYRMANLEKLKIIFFTLIGDAQQLDLSGVWQLTKLKQFDAQVDSLAFPQAVTEPLPALNQLSIKIEEATQLQTLHEIFPNLKILEIYSPSFKRDLWTQLVTAWPTLEHLTFRVGNQYLGVRMLKTLQKLPNLRRLSLLGVYKQTSLSIVEPVLAIPTLRELHLKGAWKGSVPEQNRHCRVFVNDGFVARSTV